jgi:hypothetical protein
LADTTENFIFDPLAGGTVPLSARGDLLKRLLESAAQFQPPRHSAAQQASAAPDTQAGRHIRDKVAARVPVVVHAAMPRSSLAAEDDGASDGANDRKISRHLPIAYPIETVPEITGIPRTKVFEAVRTKTLTARKIGRSTIIERVELERFIEALPIKGRVPDPSGRSHE